MPGNIDITNGGAGTVVPTLISDITGLDTQLTNLNNKNTTQDTSITSLNSKVTTNEQQITYVDSRITQVKTQAETNRVAVAGINNYVEDDGIPYSGLTGVPDGTESTKGVVRADGVTITSNNGTLSANVPPAATVVVESEADMLDLPITTNMQIAKRTDIDKIFYLNARQDAAVLSHWIEGPYSEDPVHSFNGRTGVVIPSQNDYEVGDIAGLPAILTGKQDIISTTNRLPANLVGNGSVSNDEFSYLGNVTGDIQEQIDSLQETVNLLTTLETTTVTMGGDSLLGTLQFTRVGFCVEVVWQPGLINLSSMNSLGESAWTVPEGWEPHQRVTMFTRYSEAERNYVSRVEFRPDRSSRIYDVNTIDNTFLYRGSVTYICNRFST